MISPQEIKKFNLKHEKLILDALIMVEQAQAIADKNAEFRQYEKDFAKQAAKLREAATVAP
jgi:hypothetical protein